METTDPRRVGWIALGSLGVVGLLLLVWLVWSRPPQMGADEETFRTVDALYTAFRMKDAGKVAQCESRLRARRDAGKLPASAAAHLDMVIATARGGDWQSATQRLYSFMAAQRRETR